MDKQLTPIEIVKYLDKHIIGQGSAKKAVAIALRNRWRRMQLSDEMKVEITPKNILMIGSTGVGKTEIARRISKLTDAPFIKVEATKFTEVGYVGREVESIIKELVEVSFKNQRNNSLNEVKETAAEQAEEKILDVLLGSSEKTDDWQEAENSNNKTREVFRKKLRAGELNNKEVDIEVNLSQAGMEIMGPPGMEEMTGQLQQMFSNMNKGKIKTERMLISDALAYFKEESANKIIKDEDIKIKAIQSAEQKGIVFIDEIDKIVRSNDSRGADVSREGVQRDLLPLIEGSSVTTKYGVVKTDHILFITSGAFQNSKPSDLIPELQGRLPIRVELQTLGAKELRRILVEPNFCLLDQYKELMKTEGVELSFSEDAITRVSHLAAQVNENVENIGARRLHTFMERVLEDISFDAPTLIEKSVDISVDYVNTKLEDISTDEDLSRYIL